MVQQYTEQWEKASKAGDKEGMLAAEKQADAMRTSYYRMYGISTPSDVKFTEVSSRQALAFRAFYFQGMNAAVFDDDGVLAGTRSINTQDLINNPELIANLGLDKTKDFFTTRGYKVEVLPQKSGNGTRLIINGNSINYVQFSNGQGRHGVKYIKIGGNLDLPNGKTTIKIVLSSPSEYKGNIAEEEKAGTYFVFYRGNSRKP